MSELTRLNDLHLAYDGPVPPAELAAMRAGGTYRAQLTQLVSETEFMRRQVAAQKKAIRARKADGTLRSHMFEDLRCYVRAWRTNAASADKLRAVLAEIEAVRAPLVASGDIAVAEIEQLRETLVSLRKVNRLFGAVTHAAQQIDCTIEGPAFDDAIESVERAIARRARRVAA